MTFGSQTDEPNAIDILDRAAQAGITFIDTADAYPTPDSVGVTESIIGRWLKGRRHEFIVATKGYARMGPNPWDLGNSRKHLLDAVDASLRRLGTDYIDLYQVHQYDRDTPIDETLVALDDMVRAGKVRYVGCSNFLAYRLARAIGRSEALGTARFESVQPRYNLLFREYERELFPLCIDEGIGVIAYNPIAGGMLSGKHDFSKPPSEGTRFSNANSGAIYRDRYWHTHMFEIVQAFIRLAAQAGLRPATLAVAWVMRHPAITAPIIGATRTDQLDDTIAAADLTLDGDLLQKLDELTREFRRGDSDR